jgi:transposase
VAAGRRRDGPASPSRDAARFASVDCRGARLIDLLDERIAPLERALGPLARADRGVCPLDTIPGVGSLLGLTIATEIGEVARFQSPRKLIGYAGLAPRVKQSGQSAGSGELSKAGSRTLRWAAVEAAQSDRRELNPWHRLYSDVKAGTGKSDPAKAAVARKLLIACWHVLSHEEPFKPKPPPKSSCPGSSSWFLAP